MIQYYMQKENQSNHMWGSPRLHLWCPLFNINMLPLSQIITNIIQYDNYAQLYSTMSLGDYQLIQVLSRYIHLFNEWMCHNFLQLNNIKIEVIIFGPKEKL